MIPFLGATPTQANATPSQALDPLRLLLSGSTATVQVAINPENQVAGIVYQGVFYPASLPDNVKLGELLKVLIQVEADLLLLKILSENEKSTKTTKKESSQSEILKPEEKKILKEAFKLDLKDPIPQIPNALSEGIKSHPQEIKEQIKVFFTKGDIAQNISVMQKKSEPMIKPEAIQLPLLEVKTPIDELIKINPQLVSEKELPQAKQIISKLLSSLVESTVMLGVKSEKITPEVISSVSKSIAHSAEAVILLNDISEEGIYKLLKNVLKKLINFEFGEATLAKPQSTNLETKEKQGGGIVGTPEKTSLITAPKLEVLRPERSITRQVSKDITFEIPQMVKESLQGVIQQFIKTTEVIEKIHAETPYLPQSVYFAVPFAQPLGNHSVEFFLPREKEQKEKNKKRKKTSRSYMKFKLPILGEIKVEFLTISDEVHIKIIVEDEEVKDKLTQNKYLIESTFHEIGLTVPALFIECGKVGSIKPVWLKEQLGVEALA